MGNTKGKKKQTTPVVQDINTQSTGLGLGSGSQGVGLSDNDPFIENGDSISKLREENKQLKVLLNSQERHKPALSIVIPYLKAKAQGEELKFALRSIETHFRCMNYNVVVIGDREDWFDDDMIIHIDMPVISNNPQEDVISKIKEVLISDQVAEHFIWTNDDIYFVSSVEPCDIQTLKIEGDLKDDGRQGVYSENRRRTIELLRSKKLPIHNFATHTPVMYSKNKLMELFEKLPELQSGGYLLSSVYFNYHCPHHKPAQTDWKKDNWSLRLISENPSLSAFNKLVEIKKFLNNSEQGYSKVLTDYLEKTFVESSRYEV